MTFFHKITLCFSLCLFFICQTAQAQETSFDEARLSLQKNKQTFLRTVGGISGGAAALTAGSKVLRHYWKHSKSLIQIVEDLAVPSSRSRHAKYFTREKDALKREAKRLGRVAHMINERQPAKSGKRFFSSEPVSAKTQKELRVLNSVFTERYNAFQTRLELYKRNYKSVIKTGKLLFPESTVNSLTAQAGRQALKKTVRRLPVVLLFAWALSSAEDASAMRQIQRLEENPAIVFTMTEEEENIVRRSQALTEVYVCIAAQVEQLSKMDKADIQGLIQQADSQAQAVRQVSAERERIRRTLAR